jgi:hypothetical protein
MTIKALYPTVRPTLNLDFAKTKALDPRVTFTRASTATFVGADGLIKTAASGAARFDHNPATGESLGLLVEEARTNSFLYSEQFDNAYWYQNAVSVTANSAVAPDGTLTADKIIPNTSNVPHEISKSVGVTGSYSTTIYAKNAGYNGVALNAYTGAFNEQIRVNLSTGTINSITSGATGSLTAFANGWYKITLSTTLPASSGIYITVTNNNVSSFAGDGTSGIFIWGAQLEAGSFPTSYIPTTTATVTRAADVASMTGTNFSSWYRQDEGTITAKYANIKAGGRVVEINNNIDNSDYHFIVAGPTGNLFWSAYNTPSTAIFQGSIDSSASVRNFAYAYRSGSYGATLNGITPVTGTGSNIPAVNRLWIGGPYGSSGSGPNVASPNGTIARLAFYPVRLPNAQLQALTAT